MKKFYLLKQCTGIFVFILFSFIADYYVKNIYFSINDAGLQQLMMFTAIAFILFICNLFILNYAKENPNKFMRHKVWEKMFIFILILLAISILIFITVFFIPPLQSFISSQSWIMLIVIFYFLFLINLFVLSIIHKIVQDSMVIRRKIVITWASSSLLVALILFVLPTF